MLEAALDYAARGWPVFACEVGGKRPHSRLSPTGFKGATTDPQAITATWESEPTANIGIACGPVIILDIDVKPPTKRGDIELVELVREHGGIGWTREASTPSGGSHFYFAPPAGDRINRTIGRFAPHIDVLGWGGYAVAPPSKVEGVGDYEWVTERDPVEPSAWVAARMQELSKPETSKEPVVSPRWTKEVVDVAERARRYVEAMQIAISGAGGHNALFAVACTVSVGFALPDPVAIELLRYYSAKCQPPWTERELFHKLNQAKTTPGERGALARGRR